MTIEDVLRTWSRPDVLRLALVGLLAALLWRVPVVGIALYPFRLLNTFVHELSHGFAAILTGGAFHRFTVHANREGLARVSGGNRLIVVSAGYLGAAGFGGLLILLTTADLVPQHILLALGLGLALLCLIFVRNLFGMIAGLAIAAALGAAGWHLTAEYARLLLMLLAIQMPLSALNSLVDLLRLSLRRGITRHPSDAQVLAHYTRIPAVVWAVLWCLIAIAIVITTVTLAYRDIPLAGGLPPA